MATYDHVAEELEQEYSNLRKLWAPVRNGQVRVTRHPPGGTQVDITDEYEEGFRKATDALTKAVLILRKS